MTTTTTSSNSTALPIDPYRWRAGLAAVVIMCVEWAALIAWLAFDIEGARNVYGAWVYVAAVLMTLSVAASPHRLRRPPPVPLLWALRIAKLGEVVLLVWFAHWMFAVPLAWGALCSLVWRDKLDKMIAAQEAAHV